MKYINLCRPAAAAATNAHTDHDWCIQILNNLIPDHIAQQSHCLSNNVEAQQCHCLSNNVTSECNISDPLIHVAWSYVRLNW